jgi:predicted transcriptional regulator
MGAPALQSVELRTVGDVMSIRVVTVVPEMTVRELVLTFLEEQVRGAPVLDPAGKLLGVVSEEEVMRLTLRRTGERDPDRVRVSDLMRPARLTVSPGHPLPELLRAFVDDGLRRALVVENDMLLGIVTPVDVLRGMVAG